MTTATLTRADKRQALRTFFASREERNARSVALRRLIPRGDV